MIKSILLITFILLLSSCQAKTPPEFTLDNYPTIDGSTVTIPLSEAIAAQLTGSTLEQVKPIIQHNKTHQAYVNLINGDADLIFVTYPSLEEQTLAQENDVELEIIPIVSEAFVFLTHIDNPVDSLTLTQVQDIYQGNITNWSQVGGDDVDIIAYQRPENSGSQSGFLELVMKDLDIMTPPNEWIQASMGEIIDAVASYNNKPDAIGYSYYYFVVDMWGNENVKLLEIDGVYPNNETIASKEYPITTHYYAVFNKNQARSSDVRKIVDWLLSMQGQQLAEDFGYVKVQ